MFAGEQGDDTLSMGVNCVRDFVENRAPLLDRDQPPFFKGSLSRGDRLIKVFGAGLRALGEYLARGWIDNVKSLNSA